MRKLNLFFAVFYGLLVGLSACGGKEEPPQPVTNSVNTSTGTMTAKINGVNFSGINASVDPATPSGISISGQQGDKMISISLMGLTKPGKFDAFGYTSLSGWYSETLNGTRHTWTSISNFKCKLEITKLDWAANRMSGTFSFAADSQASSSTNGAFAITDGVFTDLPIKVTKPGASVKMETLVNNIPWNASGMYIFGFPGNYSLVGSDVNGHLINFEGINSLTPGNNIGLNAYYLVPVGTDYEMWSSYNSRTSPIITITSYDPVAKKASGTFSFTGTDYPVTGSPTTKNVTQGTFTDVPVY